MISRRRFVGFLLSLPSLLLPFPQPSVSWHAWVATGPGGCGRLVAVPDPGMAQGLEGKGMYLVGIDPALGSDESWLIAFHRSTDGIFGCWQAFLPLVRKQG